MNRHIRLKENLDLTVLTHRPDLAALQNMNLPCWKKMKKLRA